MVVFFPCCPDVITCEVENAFGKQSQFARNEKVVDFLEHENIVPLKLSAVDAFVEGAVLMLEHGWERTPLVCSSHSSVSHPMFGC